MVRMIKKTARFAKKVINNSVSTSSLYKRHNPPFWSIRKKERALFSDIFTVAQDSTRNGLGVDIALGKIREKFDNHKYIDDFFTFAKEKYTDLDRFSKNNNEFVNYVDSMDCNAIDSIQWKSLRYAAALFGMHQISCVFRKKAVECAYERGLAKNSSDEEICDLFKASIDQGDFDIASNILKKKLQIKKLLYPDAKRAELYLSIFSGDDERFSIVKKRYSEDDLKFAAFLQDKRVAVVAPAMPVEKLGGEIDSYDAVLRIKYSGKNTTGDKEYKGSKTDIAYLKKYRVLEDIGSDYKNLLSDLSYIVNIGTGDRFDIDGVSERISSFTFRECPFVGTWMRVPVNLLDLLMFNVKEIKIFNSNFFLSDKPYHGGHIRKSPLKSDSIVIGTAGHDVYTQINLFRNLRRSKFFSVDNECDKILSMNDMQIAQKYEELYSGISFSEG